MLKKSDKITIVDKLSTDLKEMDGFALVSFKGLTMAATVKLKEELRAVNAFAKVYKNRLLKIALQNNKIEGVDPYLKKSTMFISSKTDFLNALKVLVNFAKDNEQISMKGGVVSGMAYGEQQIIEISKLPGQKELVAMIAGALNGVVGKFAGVLNAILTKFVGTIEAVEKKQA